MEKWVSFIAFAFILLIGCTTLPASDPSEGSYYEITEQTPQCDSGPKPCFIEYLVVDNGLILRKSFNAPTRKTPSITLRKVDRALVVAELAYVKEQLVQGRDVNCAECSVYHAFYHDENETNYLAVQVDKPSAYHSYAVVLGIQERTMALYDGAVSQTPFFIHLIYRKRGQPAIDYHLFEDGTVVYEAFGDLDGELLEAHVFRIDPEPLPLLLDGFFDSSVDFDDCSRDGYVYSYIEASDGEQYAEINTCGKGDSPADRAYTQLLEWIRS
ncbi:hypothetical protein KJ765_05930 [Candidatus Micrarchaeota archaeon]|nr:hypothetical protein [Candidatus Micrarchaeota archaeon]